MKQEARLSPSTDRTAGLPDWVPGELCHYLEHVENGVSMRLVARRIKAHPSTILRQVRRTEARRDDPLFDMALGRLSCLFRSVAGRTGNTQGGHMSYIRETAQKVASDREVAIEARRILRRLCETGAFLAIAPGLDKVAVMREGTDGKPLRIAVLDRHVAEAFALRDWIERYRKARVSRYRITSAGRAALKRLLAEAENDAQSRFRDQHAIWGERDVPDGHGARARRLRCNLAESPVTLLARRKDSEGRPFLSLELVRAAERLREDFEMAQMGPRVTQNWDRFLTAGREGGFGPSGPAEGPMAARERVSEALRDLGPGLGDIALRCCCYLEGMEAAEKRMGWSARSGKIVLRIALQRLKRHYEERDGTLSPMIG